MSRFARPALTFGACVAILSLSACSFLPFDKDDDDEDTEEHTSSSSSSSSGSSGGNPFGIPTGAAPTPNTNPTGAANPGGTTNGNNRPTETRTDQVDLSVGQRFQDWEDGDYDVETVACNQTHDFEVIHTFTVTDKTRPSDTELGDTAEAECTAAFQRYVGTPLGSSSLSLGWLYPSVGSWSNGDRTIACYVGFDDGDTLDQSVKNSRM